jgi:hypothetical protein
MCNVTDWRWARELRAHVYTNVEQGAEENMWTQEGGCSVRMEKNA